MNLWGRAQGCGTPTAFAILNASPCTGFDGSSHRDTNQPRIGTTLAGSFFLPASGTTAAPAMSSSIDEIDPE